jgi:hypothetical protein
MAPLMGGIGPCARWAACRAGEKHNNNGTGTQMPDMEHLQTSDKAFCALALVLAGVGCELQWMRCTETLPHDDWHGLLVHIAAAH